MNVSLFGGLTPKELKRKKNARKTDQVDVQEDSRNDQITISGSTEYDG